jgi:hypothetical protein
VVIDHPAEGGMPMDRDGAFGSSKGPLMLSILIVTVGVGWLLTVQGIGPGIDWIWTLGLGVVGVLTFVVSGGVDKVSVVVGPFFLVSSLLSILRQRGKLSAETEIPILVILLGVLLFVAHASRLRPPRWSIQPPSGDDRLKPT